MDTPPLAYWSPGQEDRHIRIFVSHRYGSDKQLYDAVLSELRSQGHAIQDVSLSEDMRISGPRGGRLPHLQIQAEIAARIYTADLLIAPARPATTRSDWLTWEFQLAAIGYGVPVLFVKEPNRRYTTQLVSDAAALKLPHAVAEKDAREIVRKAILLIGGRPNWDVRLEEDQAGLRKYRGPVQAMRDKIMRQYPYRASLDTVQSEITTERRQARSVIDVLLGRNRPSRTDGATSS
jgi:hypothetical protein